MMYDLPSENISSSVATGLWNLIVLKRMKVWQADYMINELQIVYRDMEKWLKVNF